MVGFGNILPTYTDTYAVWCGICVYRIAMENLWRNSEVCNADFSTEYCASHLKVFSLHVA